MYKVWRLNLFRSIALFCLLLLGGFCLLRPFVTGAAFRQDNEAAYETEFEEEGPLPNTDGYDENGEASYEEAKQYTVYLTFDDGPSAVTDEVLEILQDYSVTATFFVVGQETEYSLTQYRRIVDEGHTIGIHSYSHDNAIYDNLETYIMDFEKLEAWVLEHTGTLSYVCRMPGGSNTSYCPDLLRTEIKYYLDDKGYTMYDWDIDPRDSYEYVISSEELYYNVVSAAEEKPDQDLIVLMHDDSLRTTLPDALPQIIEYFQEAGYRFSPLYPESE